VLGLLPGDLSLEDGLTAVVERLVERLTKEAPPDRAKNRGRGVIDGYVVDEGHIAGRFGTRALKGASSGEFVGARSMCFALSVWYIDSFGTTSTLGNRIRIPRKMAAGPPG